MTMLYTGVKAAEWNVPAFEQLPVELIDRLQAGIEAIITATEVEALVADVEICGSYAFGCAAAHSDLDIAVACRNAEDQLALRAAWAQVLPQIHEMKNILTQDLKVKIDLVWLNHDNKSYNTGYSLRTRTLYGRAAGEVQNIRRAWRQATGRWEIVEKLPRIFEYRVD